MRAFGIVMLILQLLATLPFFVFLLFPPFAVLWVLFLIAWIVCIAAGGTKKVKIV